ncbi:MAG: hypothetical protein DIU70_006730 [Bacillota bacterium]|nr:MAG: hypothetical protein DIU70_00115 [Bacillota bacterium]
MKWFRCIGIALVLLVGAGCSAIPKDQSPGPDYSLSEMENPAAAEPARGPTDQGKEEALEQDDQDRTRYLRIYSVEKLARGTSQPEVSFPAPEEAPALRVAVHPHNTAAMFYPTIWDQGTDIYLIQAGQGSPERIPGPRDAKAGYALGGWLPDGTSFLVGDKVWVRQGDGEPGWTAQAEVGLAWTAALSPNRRYLALWAPNARGEFSVYDFRTHQVWRFEGPFRPCAEDAGMALAWSPDGQYLAGTDCDREVSGQGARIRIVDPFHGGTIRTIEGLTLESWLPDGRLLGLRPEPELVIVDPEGREHERWRGYGSPSPNGPFLLLWERELFAGEKVYLVDLETRARYPLHLPERPRWTENGDIAVIN